MQRNLLNHRLRRLAPAGAAALLLALGAGATLAQQTPTTSDRSGASSRGEGWSLLPYTRRGYAGINIGQSDYDDFSCGNGLFGCDDSGTRVHVYTGGLFSEWLGAEIGYLNEGRVRRGGGSTRSEGVNLSLVARAPLGAFNVFGKVGATYGRTRVSSDLLSGLDDGRARGWGRSFGAGVGYDFTPNGGVVLEWSRHAYHVPGGGRRDVDGASVGYVHRF